MTDSTHLSQNERYRQARAIFDRGLDYSFEPKRPVFFSTLKIFQELADEKYSKAYYPLSRLYGTNRDDEESQDRARYFAQLAFDWCYANRDNQDAELWGDLGQMYYCGDGVESNAKEAAFWHRKAAEHGYAESQYELGHMYVFGIGVPEDGKEVVKWWRLAAEQGHAMALVNLAMTYERGQDGVTQDYEEAAKWYRIAADQGEYSAQGALCEMLISEKCAPQDDGENERQIMRFVDQWAEIETDPELLQELLQIQEEVAAHKNT